MAYPFEWRLNDIEQKANAAAERWRLDALSSDVDNLERSLRQARSEIDELRNQLIEIQDRVCNCCQKSE